MPQLELVVQTENDNMRQTISISKHMMVAKEDTTGQTTTRWWSDYYQMVVRPLPDGGQQGHHHHKTDQLHRQAHDGFQEGHPWPAMPRKAVSKDTTSKVISIMVNNKNEAMPMKLVSKDTNDQAVPMMDVNKDTTRPCLRWLSS